MRRMPETEQDAAELRRLEFQMLYGERVREARTAAGVKQDALADRLGLTRSSVANIEAGRQGNPSAFSLILTAEALGCDPRWLLTGSGAAAVRPDRTMAQRRRWAQMLRTLAEDIDSSPLV
jgi:transcriptional regulator with XRE-family HTH domain